MIPFPALPLVWSFVQKNWKWVLIGLAVAALLGYIASLKIRVSYYKEKYEDTVATLAQVVREAENTEARLSSANNALSREYEARLAVVYQVVEAKQAALEERIKQDEASKRIRLPDSTVRLFNESTQSTKEPTISEQGNDGAASGADSIDSAEGLGYSVNDLIMVSNTNNTNHIKCVAQVLEWQSFWEKYTANVESIVNVD